MYSAFWEDVYSELFDGATILIPMIHPHIDKTVYPVLGRVLSHGFLGSGHLPVRIALPTLIRMILGPSAEVPSRILQDAFLDYISFAERQVFKNALKCALSTKFPAAIRQTVLDVLANFGCRKLPTPANLLSSIQCVAEYEFLTKPAAAICLIYSGIPTSHTGFWSKKSVSDVVSLYYRLTVTAKRVRGVLLPAQFNSENEKRVYNYFTTMIDNINTDELRLLLRFITGSSVCSSTCIEVTFNSLSGLSRRPIVHTCDPNLELPTTYVNYDDFYKEFQAILSETNREFSFRMDSV